MEIRNNPIHDRARQSIKADITRLNREAIAADADKAVTEAQDVTKDRVEISDRVGEVERADHEHDVERAERVRDLEAAHRRGDLNSDERVRKAAEQLLAGE